MSEQDTGTTLQRIRDAEEALAKAQQALQRAQSGLAAIESVAEKAESVRRHPVRNGAILLLVISIITLILIGRRNSSE